MGELLIEVMQQVFQQQGILEIDDLLDLEDFAIFQETVSRTIQLQAVSPNQICSFIQQIVYYNQCQKNHFSAYMDLKRDLDVFLGILLQCTMKKWGRPGQCGCDFELKYNCEHSHKYSTISQHFSDYGRTTIQDLLDTLNDIDNQNCNCSIHANLPMHGPSKWIKEPIPTYEQMQQMHQELDPTLMRTDLKDLYVQAITSWIYGRLFLYITPYTDPTMNKKCGTNKRIDWDFHHSERQYLENKLSAMVTEMDFRDIARKLKELGDLKKTYTQCEMHQQDREVNLLYQLRLPNTEKNRYIINAVMKAQPLGFTAVISSCQQIIGTANACELLLYEVTPTQSGTFKAVQQCSRPQPHQQVKDTYFNFSNTNFVFVYTTQEEEHTISSLLLEVKGLQQMEDVMEDNDNTMDSEDGDGQSVTSYKSTSSSSMLDLVDSFNQCTIE